MYKIRSNYNVNDLWQGELGRSVPANDKPKGKYSTLNKKYGEQYAFLRTSLSECLSALHTKQNQRKKKARLTCVA